MKKPINKLKQSEVILEIRRVNPVFVSRYRQAMRQGDQFPPILIDQNDTIISGNHRYEAYKEEFGDDYKIEVNKKTYENDAERIADAVRENAKHGNPLDGVSRKRAILKLIELGEKEEAIAQLLGVSVKRIIDMAGHFVVIRGDGKKPMKRGLEHLSGKTVTKTQYEQHDKADRAMHVANQCEQLIRWFKADWIQESDANYKAVEELIASAQEWQERKSELV